LRELLSFATTWVPQFARYETSPGVTVTLFRRVHRARGGISRYNPESERPDVPDGLDPEESRSDEEGGTGR
jgi:hypothetical protein